MWLISSATSWYTKFLVSLLHNSSKHRHQTQVYRVIFVAFPCQRISFISTINLIPRHYTLWHCSEQCKQMTSPCLTQKSCTENGLRYIRIWLPWVLKIMHFQGIGVSTKSTFIAINVRTETGCPKIDGPNISVPLSVIIISRG